VITLHHQSGNMNMFTFADPTTLVMRGSTTPTRDQLQQSVTGGAPLRTSREFLARYEAVSRDAVAWIVVRGKGELAGKVADMLGGDPRDIGISVHASNDVVIDAIMRMENAAQATESAAKWNQMATVAAAYFTSKASARDDLVEINVRMTAKGLDDLIKEYMSYQRLEEEDPPPPEEEDVPEDGD
jgi:hypothetical protein